MSGRLSDKSDSTLNELTDLVEHRGRHRFCRSIRYDEVAIAHAVRKHQPSALRRCSAEQSLGIDHVTVITRHRLAVQQYEIRNGLAREIEDVRHEAALPQQMLE